jgi:uncharacterized membrane protein
MSALSLHWIFYTYAILHVFCYIAAIKIAENKNNLTNRFYSVAMLISPIALIISLVERKSEEKENQNISIFNFLLLAVVLVGLYFIVRILPNIIAD